MLRNCCFAYCVSVWASFESTDRTHPHVGRDGAVMRLETYNDIVSFSDRIFLIMVIKIAMFFRSMLLVVHFVF